MAKLKAQHASNSAFPASSDQQKIKSEMSEDSELSTNQTPISSSSSGDSKKPVDFFNDLSLLIESLESQLSLNTSDEDLKTELLLEFLYSVRKDKTTEFEKVQTQLNSLNNDISRLENSRSSPSSSSDSRKKRSRTEALSGSDDGLSDP